MSHETICSVDDKEKVMNKVTTYNIWENGNKVFLSIEELEAFIEKNVAKWTEWFTNKGEELPDYYKTCKEDYEIEVKECAYVTETGYSDAYPFEIVRVVSEQTLEIRALDAELINPEELEFSVGGFSAHCTNGRIQKYKYSSNENNEVIRIRKSKKKRANNGLWTNGRYRTFYLASKPHKYHDYNF